VSVLPSLAVFVALYGRLFLPSLPFESRAVRESLTIMSFNIWGYSDTRATAQAIVDDDLPDVVALQELSPRMADVLAQELGGIHPFRAISIGAERYGVVVLSRYPVTILDTSQLSDPRWEVQILRIERGDHSLILYNVHLRVSNVLIYLEEGASVSAEVEASLRDREAQVERLVADVAWRSEPVIVAGDLNSTGRSTACRMLGDHLTDAHQASGWGFGHTFPAYGGSWRGIPIFPRQMRIDMIFFSDAFVALTSRVGSYHGESDHLPVVATLARREWLEEANRSMQVSGFPLCP
jgi:endonuclease/exonuclease/phosphatase family metal-dependent hydrolase